MKRLNHTPGPWYREEDGFIYGGDSDASCVADPHCSELDIDEREGNALLIAAAPTMFGKLADTVAWLDREIESIEKTDTYTQLLGQMHGKLTELRDDLAETLRKITEGS